VVDEPRVIQLLRRITDDVAVLRKRAEGGGEALLSDSVLAWVDAQRR
jgi:hypothetical protein